jgi:hypothetical protein
MSLRLPQITPASGLYHEWFIEFENEPDDIVALRKQSMTPCESKMYIMMI